MSTCTFTSTSTTTTATSPLLLLRVLPRHLSYSAKVNENHPHNHHSTTSHLTWDDFFKYRRQLKWMGLRFGLPSAFLFLTGEASILAQPLYDPTMMAFGYDP